jgi:hypothetical protein
MQTLLGPPDFGLRDLWLSERYRDKSGDECLFKDAAGAPVPRPVYGFDGGAGSCGVEKWLEGC